MATFYLPLTKDIKPKDIQRKFDAFVELYGESKMILKGDFEILERDCLIPVFGIASEVVSIGNKYIISKFKYSELAPISEFKVIIPSVSFWHSASYGLTPEVMFITNI